MVVFPWSTVFCTFIVILSALFFCEYLMYYIVISQCSWPKLNDGPPNNTLAEKTSSGALRALFIADTHLLGPYRGHWFDKLKREWQMHRAFQTCITLYNPEVVFILGDLFDEGQYCDKLQFDDYIERFASLFEVPKKTRVYPVPGNHDLGFHYRLRYDLYKKFNSLFKTSSVQFKTLKGNHFILLNSMALHGDNCYFCSEAQAKLIKLANRLNCYKTGEKCVGISKLTNYSRPIVLQHFPMYRESDSNCNERDEAPPSIKNHSFRPKWDCLSWDASEMIYDLFNPRLIFTGHTHHGCTVKHREDIIEYTVPSFNWRNKENPTFMLGLFTPNNYALAKCDMPRETTIHYIYIITVLTSVVYFIIKSKEKRNCDRIVNNTSKS